MKIRNKLNGGIAEVGDEFGKALIDSGHWVAATAAPAAPARKTRAPRAKAAEAEAEAAPADPEA